MKSSRFFEVVQKINSLILLVIGVGGLIIVGGIIWEVVGDSIRPRNDPTVVNVGGTEVDESRFFLGGFDRVAGREIVMAPLRSRVSYSSGFSSGGGYSETNNYLFFDLRDSEASWLLPTHESVIEWHSAVSRGERGSSSETAVALLFHVIDADTNGDRRLTRDDKGSVVIAEPDGTGFRAVIVDVNRVLYFERGDDGPGFLFYVSNGDLHAAQFDFDGMKLVDDVDLSASVELDQTYQDDAD